MTQAPVPVLFVTWLARANRGGQVNLLRLVAGLDPARFARAAVVPAEGPLGTALAAAGAEVFVVPVEFPPLRKPWRALHMARSTIALRRVIRRVRPAVIYVDKPAQVPVVRLARAGLPARIVWHVQTAFGSGHDRFNVRLADAVVTVCEAAEARLAGLGGTAHRVRIPNGVDLARFAPGPAPEVRAELGAGLEDFVLLFVGQRSREKGAPELYDAFARVLARRGDAWLWLAGDAEAAEADDLARRAERLGIAGRVRILGVRGDVERLLRAADVFVLPSHTEVLSLSLLEAMASARPFVATDVPGDRDLCGSGGGLVVPVGAPEALAEALLALAGDPARRAALGAAGRRHVEAHHGLPAYVAAFSDLFSSLAATIPAASTRSRAT